MASYEPCIRYTIGFFLAQKDDRVFLSTEKDIKRSRRDTDCGAPMVIPNGIVRKIQPLAEAKHRRAP
jgi:hypothetical protein